ncbi:MAG: hypothetical protein HND40_00740 [Ignavibacteriota bacterium]|nr:hypothetical protein [Ignavibacteriota bacterium]MCO6446013.1 HEAT repeat domain-containing protein [Ignavibacterium album]MCZ2270226.1 HEAT repeat domain-containing protein [Ignavibacteriales bacterium]QKJ98188.1 MAG: hypothetical protein HND40_00740 [Ignavibacteriota bacterium]HOJ06665.1 HEAT repeat domain-containing protein [Ignavibacteriaceae bacterium]
MQHEKYEELIQYYFYNEIDEADKKLLEQHLISCPQCKTHFELFKKIFNSINENENNEFEDKLLFEARAELRGYLKAQKNKTSIIKVLTQAFSSFMVKPIGIAFGGAVVLLAGLFTGYLIFNEPAVNYSKEGLNFADYSKIQNINFLDADPDDGEIEFTYESVKPGRIKGNINDSRVREILTYAILNEKNPGTRLNSINVINASSQHKNDDELKNALISVAKYDNNPGVRREAIKSFNELSVDKEIKDALIYVLLNDTSAGIRIEAINSLMETSKKGIKLDESDLTTLKDKIQLDQNNYVRYQLRNIIKEY